MGKAFKGKAACKLVAAWERRDTDYVVPIGGGTVQEETPESSLKEVFSLEMIMPSVPGPRRATGKACSTVWSQPQCLDVSLGWGSSAHTQTHSHAKGI